MLVELDVPVELDVVEEVFVAAARTRGDARIAAVMAIAAMVISSAFLVFIFRRLSEPRLVFSGFPRLFRNL